MHATPMPQDLVRCNGILRPCCADAANLVRVEQKAEAGLLRWRDECRVCGRRHLGMEVQPMALGWKA